MSWPDTKIEAEALRSTAVETQYTMAHYQLPI